MKDTTLWGKDVSPERLRRLLQVCRRRYRELHQYHQRFREEVRRALEKRDAVVGEARKDLCELLDIPYDGPRDARTIAASIIGRNGGLKGGKKRFLKVSKEEASRIMSAAARKRWDAYRERKRTEKLPPVPIWAEDQSGMQRTKKE